MAVTLINALYGGGDPFSMFSSYTSIGNARELVQMNHKQVLLLHGGQDISPEIYGEKCIKLSQAKDFMSTRDLNEVAMAVKAWKMGIPIVGICRGAQLLCALDGGKLVQHIDRHTGRDHTIVDTETGEVYKSNSCHHQMMQPSLLTGAKVLAYDTTPTTGVNHQEEAIEVDKVPEIVHFPQLNAIGIQGHPEWLPKSAFNLYCGSLIKKYLLKD